MKKKIYFVIGTHRSIIGIYSYLKIFNQLLSEYKIIISKQIKKNAINILIENFSSEQVDQIINLKKNHKIKIILVQTEFNNEVINAFNCFELNDVNNIQSKAFIFNLLISYFNIRFYIKSKIKKFLRIYFNFNIYKYRRFKKKFSLFQSSKNRKLAFFNGYYKYLYFKERYKNFKKVVNYADIFMVSHPDMAKDYKKKIKNIFYVLPKLNNFKPNKKTIESNYFKFSGELSNYRINFFKKFKNFLNKTKLKNNKEFEILINKMGLYSKEKFINIPYKNKFKFSLHPKKDKNWPFSSPVRYIEAINKGEIPITFDNFKDIISYNLSIFVNIESLDSLKKLSSRYDNKNIKIIKKGVVKYNNFIFKNNINFKKEVKKLIYKQK